MLKYAFQTLSSSVSRFLSIFRDIPGVVVACPSNGVDAVKMLRTAAKHAYMNGRIIVFIEPIALYMSKDLHKNKDNRWSFNYPSPNEEHEIGEYVNMARAMLLQLSAMVTVSIIL